MKSTGMIRKIDELGRIVIPKEIRNNLKIKDNEAVEIYVEEDKMILQKYNQMLSYEDKCNKLINICRILHLLKDLIFLHQYIF